MKYIVTAEEMKEYDNNTITKIGIPALVLMERAALKLAEAITEELPCLNAALIVAGTGNNGGDGLALARLLSEKGCTVTVCIIGNLQKATEQFLVQEGILKSYPVKVLLQEEALGFLESLASSRAGFDVIVDALFGVGLSREVEGNYAGALECVNQMSGFKVAADIPSGISADSGKVLGCAFRAALTVTFGFAKRGLYLYPGCEYAGKVVVADIGIGEGSFFGRVPEVFAYEENPLKNMPVRAGSGNKGTFGKVLVIAGFEKMAGAAVLCARAALEMGAGMVKVICPEQNREILQTALPEVLYGTCENIKDSLQWADIVAVGPGLGKGQEAADILQRLLTEGHLPMVLDADALNLLSENRSLNRLVKEYKGIKVMTPHVGELSRLTLKSVGELKEDLFGQAKDAAKQYGAIMVCKDARTVVADTYGNLYLNLSGNNGMATAGSGDVLTGIMAGLLAQDTNAFQMAAIGVYLHGLAGDFARDIYTEYGVTAGSIVENIRSLIL